MRNESKTTMHHPDIPGSTTSVNRQALEDVWADKGWVEGEAEALLPPEEGNPELTSPDQEMTFKYTDPEED